MLAGAVAVIKWVNERRDRATDILLKLEEKFASKDVMKGRKRVEDRDHTGRGRCDELDAMLRFYVVLYGVFNARQVPERSLSICFRYWLAHYFRRDRREFRRYVDSNYPTLSGWLGGDCKKGCQFFRPKQLFGEETDDKFIEQTAKEPNR